MGYLDSLNITGSALTAERFRTDIILQNLANQNTTRTEEGGPYRRRQVVLRERPLDFKSELSQAYTKVQNGGVYVEEVVESQNDLVPVYDPEHPDANEEGYVMMPNVNSAEEMVDLMAATRAYEANVTALNVAKAMAMKALEIGK
ncbi:flagellar basal body rod protein FlgC [Diplocloster agilis]|uniref:flagellar basal body rod protein FlgC n=1 Tax=Diplocloster agilis TaxID=2850323 RepID=UPI000821EC11|nr:flagellar basal body rod protein FlgC [Suonthocola fibrivorans]MCU6734571.1 flagellar basal body rod protein FlgC [Suonthocola fibrivorans]SCJ44827.1 Putative proximal rod protein [uncultured Clostridium sp.]